MPISARCHDHREDHGWWDRRVGRWLDQVLEKTPSLKRLLPQSCSVEDCHDQGSSPHHATSDG